MTTPRLSIADLDEESLEKLRVMEEEFGTTILALQPQYPVASLQPDQVQKLQALEEELGALVSGRRLADEVVFCRGSEGSRLGMCTIRLPAPEDLPELIAGLGFTELDPAGPDNARLLHMWDDRVRCQRLAVFSPDNRGSIHRSEEGSELIRIDEHRGFEFLVLFDSEISDLVCMQVAYLEGQQPGWRPPAE